MRDSALEGAAARFDRSAATLTAWQVRSFIRALKSKPASVAATMQTLQEEGMKRGAEKWERGEMDGPIPEPVTPTIDPCMCYRSAHPHVHIAHEGLTADECSRAGKALARAAGVKHVVVEPGGAKVSE